MQVVNDPAAIPMPAGRRVLVPTMGALHDGHLSLVQAARRIGDEVVVSIFVNPTQFRPGEDFERYPRTPDLDLRICELAQVDYVFMPTIDTMYPAGPNSVRVHIEGVGDRWEGAARPGHFDGVATIVTQLFLTVKPQLAVFGVKDLQQCAVVEKLIASLHLGVELYLAPTMREPDGLAMSSRNRYLSPDHRAVAPRLHAALCEAQRSLFVTPSNTADSVLSDFGKTLPSQFDMQYFAIVNKDTMQETEASDPSAWLIAAAKLGGTRLIDNIQLWPA